MARVLRHLLDILGYLCQEQIQSDRESGNHLRVPIHMEKGGALKGAAFWLVAICAKAGHACFLEENVPGSFDRVGYV